MQVRPYKFEVVLRKGESVTRPEVHGLEVIGTGLGLHLSAQGHINVTHLKSGLSIGGSFRTLGAAFLLISGIQRDLPGLGVEANPVLYGSKLNILRSLIEEVRRADA
jgi:hypothetical protein